MINKIKYIFRVCFFIACLCFAANVSAGILVVAPHPDDELLIAGGVIYNAVNSGMSVKVVYITNGDYRGTETGYLRQNEAVAGQSWLGVDEDSLIFLGYPDGYLVNLFYDYPDESDAFTAPNGQTHTYGNRGLGRADYHTYRWGHPADYNKYNLLLDIQEILLTYKPEYIITTSEYDRHSDHSITYELTRLAISNVNNTDPQYNPTIYKTIVHWGSGWPGPLDREAYFSEIPGLSDQTSLNWEGRASIDVPFYAQSAKVNAISEHRSQGGVSGFLGRFVHKDEIFWAEKLFGSNDPPVPHAGFDQTAQEGNLVFLDGSESRGSNNSSLIYQWSQTAGPAVELSGSYDAEPGFTSPSGLNHDQYLVFQLMVSDGISNSISDSVHIRVKAVEPYLNIAPLADVSASSENAGTGQLAIKAVDGIVDGYPGDSSREWATLREGAGAWLCLDWPDHYISDRVVVYDRPNEDDHVLEAALVFSDGSIIELEALDNIAGESGFTFDPVTFTDMCFIVDRVSHRTRNIGLAEIEVFGILSEQDRYFLALAVDPSQSGSVSKTPDQTSYASEDLVELYATASTGYNFSHWSGDVQGTENPVTLTMDRNKIVTAHFITDVTEETISTPSVPEGPSSGTAGFNYTYATGGSSSSLGHPVEYRFDWGDGSYSQWSETASASKTWSAAGTYAVRAQARSASDTSVVSDWSGSLAVVIEPLLVLHTVDTSPSGLQIVVDGQSYTAPQTFSWEPGSSHTLSAPSPQSGASGERYVYSSWNNGGDQTQTITASSAPVTYTASFITQYSLVTSASPAQAGAVSPSGQNWYNQGQSVQITATPAAGYEFSHWSGDVQGTDNPVTLTMDASKSVNAHFAELVETVSTPSVPEGPASGTTGVSYTYTTGGSSSSLGHPVEYRFDWDDGSYSQWSETASASRTWSAAGTYAVMAQARSASDTSVVSDWSGPLAVVIEPLLVLHTVDTSPSGLQIVVDGQSYTAPQTFSWEPGSSLTLSAPSPQSGASGERYVYSSWSNGGDQTQTITASSSAATYTASFVTQYSLVTSASPAQGGAVSPSGQNWYDQGQSVQITANPAAGYEFSHWSGDVQGTDNPVTVTMDGNKSVTAEFAILTETVSTPSVPQGQESGTAGVSYTYTTGGSSSSLGHPVEYRFDWGDGSYSQWSETASASKTWSAAGTYAVRAQARSASDTSVVSDWSGSLSVAIEPLLVLHTVDTSPSGLQIVVDGQSYTAPQTFSWEPGTSHTLSAPSPQSGASGERYVYSSWSNGGDQTQTITASSSAATYTASFATQYSLVTSASPAQAGAVSPSGQNWYNQGQSVQITATPAAGYEFSHWSGDVQGTDNPVTVTMDDNKSVTAEFAALSGSLVVTPSDSYNVEGRAGGPFRPNRTTYTLTNTGGTDIIWRATKTSSWLSVSSESGILGPGNSIDIALSITNRETRSLAPGLYTDVVLIENMTNGNGDTSIQVNLTIITR